MWMIVWIVVAFVAGVNVGVLLMGVLVAGRG